MYKVLAQILRRKLNEYAKNILGEYQTAFRKQQVSYRLSVCFKENTGRLFEYKLVLCTLLMDFKQAYGRVDSQKYIKQ